MNAQPSSADLLRAFLSRPADPRLGLYTGDALYREGQEEAAVAVWALSEDVDPHLRRLKDSPRVPAEARAISARADTAFRDHFTHLHRRALDTLQQDTADDLTRVRRAIWPMTHNKPFDWRTPLQQPLVFYMPDLPATPVTPTAQLPWAAAVERAWEAIRDEYQAAVGDGAAMAPYVPAGTRDPRWSTLRGTLDW